MCNDFFLSPNKLLKNFFQWNWTNYSNYPGPKRQDETKKSIALGHPPGNRPLIATSNDSGVETAAESPFPVHGSDEKNEERGGEGSRRGEGIDYWSLCQANAISRIEDSIQGDVNIVPRMNDEFFASLPPPPDSNICPRNNMAYSHSSSTCVKGWREKKKKGYRDININSRGGGGSKFLSPSRNEIFRSSRNSWLKLRESKKKFY